MKNYKDFLLKQKIPCFSFPEIPQVIEICRKIGDEMHSTEMAFNLAIAYGIMLGKRSELKRRAEKLTIKSH